MKIFIIEDDQWFAEMLGYHLGQNQDYELSFFKSGLDAFKEIHTHPDVVIIDYNLPDIKGDEILRKIKAYSSEISCLIVSAQQDIEIAINLFKKGADDYIIKNNNTHDHIWHALGKITERKDLKKEVIELKTAVDNKYSFSNLIKGNSPKIEKVFQLMNKGVASNITVSIEGETGTGKELVAKAIHYKSPRNKQKFVAVNVAAIPAELLESELFGYEKGAFTGADKTRIGMFEEANMGTLFLDEIAEMSLPNQAKLLRAIQERQITRLGSNKLIDLDIRIIIATHKNLQEEVKNGRFREDLFYRLYGLPIFLPPLRERGNDILLLAKFFSDEFSKQNNISKKKLSLQAQTKLLEYTYPGNIRELKAAIDLATLMSDGDFIEAENINFIGKSTVDDILENELTLREYQTKIVQHFLAKYDKNVILVANKLDIGKSTIYRMINNNEVII